MPSHLTRVVFRSLIANEPLLYRGCRYRAPRPRTLTHHGVCSLPQIQRRTFLNFFKPQRKLKPMEMPAGLEKMVELTNAQKNAIRPPKPADVAEALMAFFAQRKGTFERFHIVTAHNAFQYLLQNPRENGQPWLSKKELVDGIFETMLQPSKRPEAIGQAHIDFGRAILHQVANMAENKEAEDNTELKDGRSEDTHINMNLIRLLSLCGAATEARNIAVDKLRYDHMAGQQWRLASLSAWGTVLKGLIREGDPDEVLKWTDILQEQSIPLITHMQRHLVVFFAERKDLERAKFWYSYPVVSSKATVGRQPSGSASSALLKACALNGDLSFGQQVVATMLKNDMPPKESWDAIFLWSAAIGKGVDEVDRMMNVLVRRNDDARQKNPALEVIRPDIETINALVEVSMAKQDPYSAERYIALGEKRGILPNERTFTMQVQYRISVGDIDGARAAYFNLQGSFSGAEQSVAVINQLIQVLCVSKQHHFDELMAMVDDLHERKANFAPETVAALTLLHLRRGEIHDAMDLLQVHAHQYSPAQRVVIQKALLDFILDGETSTADAWDGYQILRNVFPETPRDDRIPIMNEFFARNRSDMACHVFFHMRNHISEAHRANRDVYVAAFTGFARCADAESLELAHNQLKLDMSVDLDTRLRNSLMLAYAATRENKKAIQFWREICESKEGPSYNSIAIAFRSCEGMHWGGEHARSIWKRLKEQDVEIDKTIWTAYMSAIARNHHHDEAQALIETVEEEYGFTPDLHILGSWFNMTASIEKQTHVEEWIKQRYPEVWKEMEALGYWVTMDGFGYRQYNINRDLDPPTATLAVVTVYTSDPKVTASTATTMRIQHFLVGFVGLAGLASAAPAPSGSAPFDVADAADTADEAGEVWACQKPTPEIGGVCGSVTALNRCQDFSNALAGRVRYLSQLKGAVCYYYPQKGCSTGQRSLEIDSRQWKYASNIAENVGKQLVSVHCFQPKLADTVEGAFGSTEHQARSATPATVTVNEEPIPVDLADISALAAPGDTIICRSTLNDGSCEVVHAQDRCVTIGNEVSHKVRSIYQAAGSVCKYFESDCSARYSVVSANSRSKPLFVQLDENVGRRIGLVLCRNNWPPSAKLDPGSTPVDTPSSDVVIWTSDYTKSVRSEALVEPLYICDHENQGGRCTFYRSPGCTNNPFTPNFIQSLRIMDGYQCAFYHESNCQANGSPPNYEQAKGGDKIMNTVPYQILSMSCYPSPLLSGEEAAPAVVARHGEGPGDSRICDVAYFQWCKDNVNAMNRCSSFDPTAGGPNSLIQFQGAFCKWYRGYGCSRESKDDEPMGIDSRANKVDLEDLGLDNNLFKSLECRAEPF
ncbi:Nn.00g110280.m01.CDS01 [Neocucurbitaria sp. VM-36]